MAGVAGASGAAPVEVPANCPQPHPGPSPLSRLRNSEFNRSLRALLPEGSDAADSLAWLPETPTDEDPTLPVTDDFVERAHRLAHDVAQLLTDDVAGAAWLGGCDVATRGELECRDALLEPLLERAYRRAITDEDRTELAQVFADGEQLGGNFTSGLRAVLEVALLSPEFTYLVEQGDGQVSGDAVELTSYERAARLAYFLTAGPPDAELLRAAKSEQLGPEQLGEQARRLLRGAEGRAATSAFYARLMHMDSVGEKPQLGFSNELGLAAAEGARRFIEDVVFDGAGTLRALLTEPSVWVNQPLADFYGYASAPGDAFQRVTLDDSRHAGLFTQPAYLAAFSHSEYTSPVHRSLPILRNLLCYELPALPGNVPVVPVDVSELPTTRQRLEAFTADPQCQSCHHDINPIGFSFEHYDAVGKWRDTEQGAPIDASGELGFTDASGPFTDAVDLMRQLAESDDVKACFVTQWLRRAYRRSETADDACVKAELTSAFQASDGKIEDLLLALAQTDNFRYRLSSELAP